MAQLGDSPIFGCEEGGVRLRNDSPPAPKGQGHPARQAQRASELSPSPGRVGAPGIDGLGTRESAPNRVMFLLVLKSLRR